MANSVAEALMTEKNRANSAPQATYEPPPEEAPQRKSILGALGPLSKIHAKINPVYKFALTQTFGDKYKNFINPQQHSVYRPDAFETQQGNPNAGSNPLFDKYKGMV